MPKIKFKEDTHQYFAEDDRELVSVSKFTEQFKPYINWAEKAKSSSKNLKKYEDITISPEQLMAKWEKKRKASSEIGTLYHSIRENQEKDVPHETVFCPKDENFKYSIPIENLENGKSYPEIIVYDFEHMICGQIDKVEVRNNCIDILDYKTDEYIKFKGYSTAFKRALKLLPPLSHLDECNGNIYSIKMSLYMYLLWKANHGKLKPGKIILEHINLKRDPANDNIPVLEDGKPVVLSIEKIIVPYRKSEVLAMLKTIQK